MSKEQENKCCEKCYREGEVVIVCGCPCHSPQPHEQLKEWEKQFDLLFADEDSRDFINDTVRTKVKHFIVALVQENISQALEKKEREVDEKWRSWHEQDRQFIENVLDGVDIADEQMGNTGGGTKAIRLALKFRGLLS